MNADMQPFTTITMTPTELAAATYRALTNMIETSPFPVSNYLRGALDTLADHDAILAAYLSGRRAFWRGEAITEEHGDSWSRGWLDAADDEMQEYQNWRDSRDDQLHTIRTGW